MNFVRAARVLASSALLLFFCSISLLALPTPRPDDLDYFPPKNFLPQTPQKMAEVREALYHDLIGTPSRELSPRFLEISKKGFPANSRFDDRDRSTPLTHAAGFGQLAAVELFLNSGARVNDFDTHQRTALWVAASTPMLGSTHGLASTEVAVLQKHFKRDHEIYIEIIRALLKHGAQTEIADKNGTTPLAIATTDKREQVVKVLLEAGANPNHRDGFGESPVMWASYYGYKEIVALMQKHGGEHIPLPDERQRKLDIALSAACAKGDEKAVSRWLDAGANANAFVGEWSPDPRQSMKFMEAGTLGRTTPLLRSIAFSRVVRRLLKAGADANRRDGEGQTPLMQADFEVSQMLLVKGASPNARDHEGETVLMYAARAGDLAKVRVLLKHGADANKANNAGTTPLMRTPEEEILKLLVASGADINARDKAGSTRLIQTAFSTSGEGGSLIVCSDELGKVLLELGANPDVKDSNGNTALMLMSAQGEDEYMDGDPIALAKSLLQHGAWLDLKNKAGKTALQIAMRHHSKTLARLFRDWKPKAKT